MSEELADEQRDLNDVNEEIRQLDREWAEALMRNDLETLDRIMPDGFMFTDTFGDVLNKTEFLKVIKRGELTFEILKREDAKLSVGTTPLPAFRQPTAAFDPRQFQLGLRLSF